MPVQAHEGGGGTAIVTKFATTHWKLMVSFTPRPLYLQEKPGTHSPVMVPRKNTALIRCAFIFFQQFLHVIYETDVK